MSKKKKQISRSKPVGEDRVIDLLERIGVGLLYGSTNLGQNSIAQIMGMGDARVNEILKGIKKPKK